MSAGEQPAPEWPRITVDSTCHACGRLIFSELVRPEILASYPMVAWYWHDQIIAHAARCEATPAPAPAPRPVLRVVP